LKFHVYFSFFSWPPGGLTLAVARLKKRKKTPGEKLPVLIPNQIYFGCCRVEFRKNLATLSRKFAASANRRF